MKILSIFREAFSRALLLSVSTGALVIVPERAAAVAVDAEVLFLVDVTRSVSNSEFDTLMESYAQAFESGAVLDSLQGGQEGSIAAALIFYGDKNQQSVGVGWMEMSDAADAQVFATALRNATRPGNPRKTAIADALDVATPYFGDETGGVANGFESASQSIMFAADGIDDGSKKTGGSRETTVQLARDNALASGVDVINALTIGAAGSVDDYFAANVIGGAVGGSPATVANLEDFAELPAGLEPVVANQIAAVIPEPSWWWSAGLAAILCMRRRREQLSSRTGR